MNTSDGIWIPSYYRRRHRFSWVRAAGGPQRVDWVTGAVLAVIVLGLFALARGPHHEGTPSAAVAASTGALGSEINADRVAYVPSAIDK
jgi:hypothetical protein